MNIKTLTLIAILGFCVGSYAEDENTVTPSVLSVKERVEILKVIEVASKKEIDESVEAELEDEIKQILAAAAKAEEE